MKLFFLVAAATAFAHGPFPRSVCEATCHFPSAKSALERRTVAGTGTNRDAAWKKLGQACRELGAKAELRLWNPNYENNSSAEPEFFPATKEKACSPLLPIGAAFRQAEDIAPASGEQALKLGNYRVTYLSARKVSPTQTVARQVQIFKNEEPLYLIDGSAAPVLLEKYGGQITVLLKGPEPGSVLSKQVITMAGIQSHCHAPEAKLALRPAKESGPEGREAAHGQEKLRGYLRSLRCVK